MRPKYTPSFIARFWARVERGGPDECWPWTGRKGPYGHGQISFRIGRETSSVTAPSVAWELLRGPIPPGLFACHNCPHGDNPTCVNPAHLFLGTPLDNSRDMVRKGRSLAGDRNPMRQHPERRPRGDAHGSRTKPEALARGERHGGAKLTEAIVLDARARHARGEASVRALASEHGVSIDTMSEAVHRRKWKHLP